MTPPRLLSVSPADSLLNTKVTEIELKFDEFIVVTNPSSEVTISPILPFPLTIEGIRRTVTVSIPDTLLLDNTTYRISFGKAIQDLNENNPFTGYSYIFSTGAYFDTLSLSGWLPRLRLSLSSVCAGRVPLVSTSVNRLSLITSLLSAGK